MLDLKCSAHLSIIIRRTKRKNCLCPQIWPQTICYFTRRMKQVLDHFWNTFQSSILSTTEPWQLPNFANLHLLFFETNCRHLAEINIIKSSRNKARSSGVFIIYDQRALKETHWIGLLWNLPPLHEAPDHALFHIVLNIREWKIKWKEQRNIIFHQLCEIWSHIRCHRNTSTECLQYKPNIWPYSHQLQQIN